MTEPLNEFIDPGMFPGILADTFTEEDFCKHQVLKEWAVQPVFFAEATDTSADSTKSLEDISPEDISRQPIPMYRVPFYVYLQNESKPTS